MFLITVAEIQPSLTTGSAIMVVIDTSNATPQSDDKAHATAFTFRVNFS
jgi:hypothetical protein